MSDPVVSSSGSGESRSSSIANGREIVIASRSSPLALRQSRLVGRLIQERLALACRITAVTTEADRRIEQPITSFGGKGIFVKELEKALLEGDADIAVHSLKDVPGVLPRGLVIEAILERHYAADVLILAPRHAGRYPSRWPQPVDLKQLPAKWSIGTSSLRRRSQLLAHRPSWSVVPLRGNITTRLTGLNDSEIDGVLLARAGVERMADVTRDRTSLPELIAAGRILALDEEQIVPAPGQGALAIECAAQHTALRRQLAKINHRPTARCVQAERALARRFEADCQAPFAAYAWIVAGELNLRGLLEWEKGLYSAHDKVEADADAGVELARRLHQRMQALGAPAKLSVP